MDTVKLNITNIEPEYRFDDSLSGSFKITFYGTTTPYWLSYQRFLHWLLRNDIQLQLYVSKNFTDMTMSHVVQDLYEIGYPVENSVREYMNWVESSIDAELITKLMFFFDYMKHFNTGSFEGPFT